MSIKFAFIGDISFNDKYIDMYEQGVNPFGNIHNVLKECDYVVGNLENSCEGEKVSSKPLPKLKTTCETLGYLKKVPVNIVTLANNHIGDNYELGFDKTISKLKSEDILFLGAGYDESIETPLIIKKNDISVAFFNYYGNDFVNSVPLDCSIKLNFYNRNKILSDIIKYKEIVNHVILLIHWGAKVEGSYLPDYYMFDDAKAFIDAGSSLIIGHHSHTFQPYEKINEKYIFYSLGNFCFSDYKYNDRLRYLDKKRALMSGGPIISFSTKKIELKNIVYFKNKRTSYSILKKQPFILRINQRFLWLVKIRFFWYLVNFYYKRVDWIFKMFFRSDKSLNLIIKDITDKKLIKRAIIKMFGKT